MPPLCFKGARLLSARSSSQYFTCAPAGAEQGIVRPSFHAREAGPRSVTASLLSQRGMGFPKRTDFLRSSDPSISASECWRKSMRIDCRFLLAHPHQEAASRLLRLVAVFSDAPVASLHGLQTCTLARIPTANVKACSGHPATNDHAERGAHIVLGHEADHLRGHEEWARAGSKTADCSPFSLVKNQCDQLLLLDFPIVISKVTAA